jgi:transmembrane sensor
MSKLLLPLKQVLRDEPPRAAELERLWSATKSRMAPRPQRRTWLVATSVAATAALGLVLVGLRLRVPAAGPLELADGGPVGAWTAQTARAVRFADGSRVELEAGAALEPMSNDAVELALLLRRGRVAFTLTPGQARRWTIDAGLASMIASGARFAAYRDESSVDIRVYAGMVTVRGENVPGRVRRLGAGEVLRVTGGAAAPSPIGTSPVVAPTSPGAAPPSRVAAPPSPAHRAPPGLRNAPPAATRRDDWRGLARTSQFNAAYDTLGAPGVRAATREATSVDELLLVADVARLSGHPADALLALERAAHDFPGDRRAGLAAYTAGRVHADELHDPRRGADAFSDAIDLGLPDALGETAYFRLVETRAASGDRDGAHEAARRYEARFPNGHFQARLHALLGGP